MVKQTFKYIPSSLYAATPLCSRCCSNAVAIVDFPDAERPVSQMVIPSWPRYLFRSSRVSPWCQVMFLYISQYVSDRISGKKCLKMQLQQIYNRTDVHNGSSCTHVAILFFLFFFVSARSEAWGGQRHEALSEVLPKPHQGLIPTGQYLVLLVRAKTGGFAGRGR